MSHSYEMYHTGNRVNICMLTYCSWTYPGDHFEMYINIESLCYVTGTNSVVGHLYFKNKIIGEKNQLCGYHSQGVW